MTPKITQMDLDLPLEQSLATLKIVMDSKPMGRAECWSSTARQNDKGYPMVTVKGSTVSARRAVYGSFYGMSLSDLSGYQVHSTCGNETCVNPDHLWSKAETLAQKCGHTVKGRNVMVVRGKPSCRLCRQIEWERQQPSKPSYDDALLIRSVADPETVRAAFR